MTTLFDAYQLGELRLANRIVMAPMTRSRATTDGLPSPSAATYYAQRASAGLLVSEGIQPSLQGQSNPLTPGLHADEQVAAWQPITAAVHDSGGRIYAQIMHGGRIAHVDNVGVHPVGPSPVAAQVNLFTAKGMQPAPVPRELTLAEVSTEARSYAGAAVRAIEAGFDGVELHGANGYLLQQFLSSNTNLRTDAYGGSPLNRIRFAVEALEAAAAAIGSSRVGLRLSPGAHIWDIHEADVEQTYRELLRALAPLGLSYLHLTAVGEPEHISDLRKEWPGALIVNPGHGLASPTPAGKTDGQYWLEQGADLVSFGRHFLANPDLVERYRGDLPLAAHEVDTMYGGGDKGYIDYPTYRH